jgi:HAD superfamily hydrolase (TIGR01549 family)
MKDGIKHIWFDYSDTLAVLLDEHDKVLYETYSRIVNKPIDENLINEVKEQYKIHKSNSAIFSHIGMPPGYWSREINSKDPATLYALADPEIPTVLKQLKEKVQISIFSNMDMKKLLPAIGIAPNLFTHFLSSADIKNPKPALDGFYKIIELSNLPAENILFVGDSIDKEMIPAKKVGLQTGLMWSSSEQADYSFLNFSDLLKIFN